MDNHSLVKTICFLFIFSCLVQTVQPEAVNAGWNIAVTKFQGSGLSTEHLHHLTGFPLSLIREIERTPFHYLSSEEQKKAWEEDKARELRKLRIELTRTIQERDLLFLKRGTRDKLSEKESEIGDIRRKIETTIRSEYTAGEDHVKAEILLDTKNAAGELLEYPAGSEKIWAYRNNVDCIIGGIVEIVGDMLYVEIQSYSTAAGGVEILYRGTFFGNERDTVLLESRGAVRSYIYGREWSDIEVDAEPRNAVFRIDGITAVPDASRRFRYLVPGTHSITVSADGYREETIQVSLQDRQVKYLKTSLEKMNPISLLIRSFPSGADVFIDSVMSGSTPLYKNDLVPPATIVVRKEEYKEKICVADDEISIFDFHLHPASVDMERIIESSRNRFYHGLAAFLLSLPVTVVTYGRSEQFAYAYNSAVTTGTGSIDELDRLKAQSSLWYTAYLGSLFINSILFTDTIIGMTQYIKSSQEY